MDEDYRIVEFDTYCKTCKYQSTDEGEEPCYECLAYPLNLYSHKPVKWVTKGGQ